MHWYNVQVFLIKYIFFIIFVQDACETSKTCLKRNVQTPSNKPCGIHIWFISHNLTQHQIHGQPFGGSSTHRPDKLNYKIYITYYARNKRLKYMLTAWLCFAIELYSIFLSCVSRPDIFDKRTHRVRSIFWSWRRRGVSTWDIPNTRSLVDLRKKAEMNTGKKQTSKPSWPKRLCTDNYWHITSTSHFSSGFFKCMVWINRINASLWWTWKGIVDHTSNVSRNCNLVRQTYEWNILLQEK